MSVMERPPTQSALPIYHKSIDWDALFERYPVPDVFERTRWRWSWSSGSSWTAPETRFPAKRTATCCDPIPPALGSPR